MQGANTSSLLSDEIDDISRDSNLTPVEVRRLYMRFQQLDRNRSGNLDADELRMIPELAMNPLMPRIVALFDSANFAQFVRTMAIFGRNGSKEAKTDFAFRVYDVDGDGYISSDDLRRVLQMMVGADNLDEATSTRIVQKVIDDADTDGDQRISREEFTLVRFWASSGRERGEMRGGGRGGSGAREWGGEGLGKGGWGDGWAGGSLASRVAQWRLSPSVVLGALLASSLGPRAWDVFPYCLSSPFCLS